MIEGETFSETGSLPKIAVFCPTFLKPEMLHVYRQVAGLRRVRAIALAFKHENEDRFPFAPVHILHRTRLREFRRFWSIRILKLPQQAYPSEVRSLSGAINEGDCRLLHIYFGQNGVFWLPYLRKSRLPVIVSFHGADVRVDRRSKCSGALLNELFSKTRLLLARSQSLANSLIEIGCPPEKIEIQRTGIPLDEYPFTERRIPEGGQWKLLQACRLVPKKGLEATVASFAEFRSRWPNSVLTIAGDGPMREPLERLVDANGLNRSIRFTGFLRPEELRKLYYECHFFLHPSETALDGNREGVPNSILEAMATGLPSVATYHGGIPEAIEDGKSGILVPESDPRAIAAALFKLADDPPLAKAIGVQGARVVRAHFDLERQIRRLEEIYLRIGN
jgi:colanic acid/amylovoran biosynthesis glycosyltransferase